MTGSSVSLPVAGSPGSPLPAVALVPAPSRLSPRPKYLSLALAAMHRSIAYRNSLLINLLTGLVFVAVLYYLWETVFGASPVVEQFTWERMRTYLLVAYGVNTLLSFYSEARMFQTIRTGEVAVDLLRPLDFQTAQLAQASGAAVVEGVIGVFSTAVLGVLIFVMSGPASLTAALLFPISVALGFLVKFHLSFLTGLLCFWTMNSVGLLWARGAVTNIFSGAVIPLSFFPGWLHTVAVLAPFQAVVYLPVSIYLGDLSGGAVWQALALQASWAVALWLLARVLWRPSIRALTIQGG